MKRLLFAPILLLGLLSMRATTDPALHGGDYYQVFLNDKMIAEGHNDYTSEAYAISRVSESQELRVKYSHCGKKGTQRKLVLLDGTKPVKTWVFKDREGGPATIGLALNEILSLDLEHKTADIRYYSAELPLGRRMISLRLPS